MAYKSRFTDKPTKKVSAGQLAQKTKDSYSKAFDKKQREVRREKQDKEEKDFKSQLKVVPKTKGTLYQEEAPTFNPMTGKYERTTLADKRIQLANKYGPTFREILGDVGSGLRSMSGGLGDFIARGGVTGSVLSNIYNKFKSGAKTGIETVGGVYDNLRSTFSGQPTVVRGGGSSDITVTEQPQFPYNFETTLKPKPDPLQPSEMSQEQFMQSYPELYSGNPLFRQQNFQPIKVSDMNMSGVMASNVGQNVLGNLQNLQNLAQQYNLDSLRFDPFKGQIGFENQLMINDTPINYNFGVGDRGLQGGFNFAFKNGGSVDKYAGLGYKLK